MWNVAEPRGAKRRGRAVRNFVGASEEKTPQLKTGRVIKYYMYLDIHVYTFKE
jgi:hypothetical protein